MYTIIHVCMLLLDLYGLLFFLGVDPYLDYKSYNQLLWTPFLNGEKSLMVKVFSDIMWRNSKCDVAEEVRWGGWDRGGAEGRGSGMNLGTFYSGRGLGAEMGW